MGLGGEEAHQGNDESRDPALRDPPRSVEAGCPEYEDVDPTSLLVDGHNQDLPAKEKTYLPERFSF